MADEVGKARMRKFARQIDEAGWVLDPGQEGTQNAISFWLYSFNVRSGSRLVGQMTIEGYRAMRSGEMFGVKDPSAAAQVLGTVLEHYDGLPPEGRSKANSDLVVSAMAAYASATRTFQSLPALSSCPNQHFMVFDWLTGPNNRIFRPAAVVSEHLLSPDMLEGFADQVLALHLASHPSERPI